MTEVFADPSGRAVKGWGLRLIACCDCGFEFRLGAWLSVCCGCSVFSGRCFCNGPISRPERL